MANTSSSTGKHIIVRYLNMPLLTPERGQHDGGVVNPEGITFRQGLVVSANRESEPYLLTDVREAIKQTFNFRMFVFAYPIHGPPVAVPVSQEAVMGWPEIATEDRFPTVFLCLPPDQKTTFFLTNQKFAVLGSVQITDPGVDVASVRHFIQSSVLGEHRVKCLTLSNGCPISLASEATTTLMELCRTGHNIGVITEEDSSKECHTAPLGRRSSLHCGGGMDQEGKSVLSLKMPEKSRSNPIQARDISSSPSKERHHAFGGVDPRLSFNTSKNLPRLPSPMTSSTQAKKFLISYVQKEGRDKAILLKAELELHGCSVFLDFENIAAGMDWQDILNNAVKTCEVFVPIVTDSYGETLWTNREVKLADVMKKVVVPVSLIDSWPPSCLAIQFCTTQHVRWKSNYDGEPGNTPPAALEDSVKDVAREIMELYRMVQQQNVPQPIMTARDVETPPFDFRTAAKRRRSTVRSYPYDTDNTATLQEAKKSRDGRPLIVVCAHKAQTAYVDNVRDTIGVSNFDIWSTTDSLDLWPDQTPRESAVTTPLFDATNRPDQRLSYMSNSSQDTVSTISPAQSISGCLFQEKADEAAIVVLVLSAAFASSSICKNFLYYMERRKRFIPVTVEDFPMPGWMTTLIGNKEVEDGNSSKFPDKLKVKLNRAVNLGSHAECTDEDLLEASTQRGMDFLARNDIPRERTVYISGSPSQGLASAFLSREIASELARLPRLCVATGGCLGVGEALSSHFLDVKKSNWNSRGKMPENIYHILPTRDDSNQLDVADQNPDGSFNPAATGKTFFFGKSLRERETVVGRYFRVCILIDGDSHAAHEATEAMWADNVVLPVLKSGGAAGGDFDFRMDKPPAGVPEAEWAVLRSKDSTDSEIAVAIRQILEVLMPDAVGTPKDLVQKCRTPRTPKPKRVHGVPVTPSPSSPSPYGLRDRTGMKKRMFDTDEETIPEEEESASKYRAFF
ncbi:hypothetical protein BV898_15974 [Hypsibius exemplaris]|uniref:TIR domain-containing protein n=1 Tax=Hypsibius exemplaris TaxID=2072580 RepID=A0A9X6NDW2_HYPEX|nr:hypothetical protein BV898_15974 [Hypsibius exemplaris]